MRYSELKHPKKLMVRSIFILFVTFILAQLLSLALISGLFWHIFKEKLGVLEKNIFQTNIMLLQEKPNPAFILIGDSLFLNKISQKHEEYSFFRVEVPRMSRDDAVTAAMKFSAYSPKSKIFIQNLPSYWADVVPHGTSQNFNFLDAKNSVWPRDFFPIADVRAIFNGLKDIASSKLDASSERYPTLFGSEFQPDMLLKKKVVFDDYNLDNIIWVCDLTSPPIDTSEKFFNSFKNYFCEEEFKSKHGTFAFSLDKLLENKGK